MAYPYRNAHVIIKTIITTPAEQNRFILAEQQPLLPPTQPTKQTQSFYEAIGKSVLVLYNGYQFRDNLK